MSETAEGQRRGGLLRRSLRWYWDWQGPDCVVFHCSLYACFAATCAGAALLAAWLGVSPSEAVERATQPGTTYGFAAWCLAIIATFVGALLVIGATLVARYVSNLNKEQLQLELQLSGARSNLAAIERDIADRTMEHDELSRRLREATALMELTEQQAAAIRNSLAQAGSRRRHYAAGTAVTLALGVITGYIVNWTSDGLRPPWFWLP